MPNCWASRKKNSYRDDLYSINLNENLNSKKACMRNTDYEKRTAVMNQPSTTFFWQTRYSLMRSLNEKKTVFRLYIENSTFHTLTLQHDVGFCVCFVNPLFVLVRVFSLSLLLFASCTLRYCHFARTGMATRAR